jgi:hypothetical protein
VRPTAEETDRARALAAQARRLAHLSGSEEVKRTLLAIAEDYDRLVAQLLADRETSSDPS